MTSTKEEYPEIPLQRMDVLATEPTAFWRVLRPEIDYNKCVKCWMCVDYCPEGIISKSEKGPVIDYDFCKGCGVCANECSVKAISMVKEEW